MELFFECASETEVGQRTASESFISSMEVQVASTADSLWTGSVPSIGSARLPESPPARQPHRHVKVRAWWNHNDTRTGSFRTSHRHPALDHPSKLPCCRGFQPLISLNPTFARPRSGRRLSPNPKQLALHRWGSMPMGSDKVLSKNQQNGPSWA